MMFLDEVALSNHSLVFDFDFGRCLFRLLGLVICWCIPGGYRFTRNPSSPLHGPLAVSGMIVITPT